MPTVSSLQWCLPVTRLPACWSSAGMQRRLAAICAPAAVCQMSSSNTPAVSVMQIFLGSIVRFLNLYLRRRRLDQNHAVTMVSREPLEAHRLLQAEKKMVNCSSGTLSTLEAENRHYIYQQQQIWFSKFLSSIIFDICWKLLTGYMCSHRL